MFFESELSLDREHCWCARPRDRKSERESQVAESSATKWKELSPVLPLPSALVGLTALFGMAHLRAALRRARKMLKDEIVR